VSHHDTVSTNMSAIWKALGAYSQTWQLMQRGVQISLCSIPKTKHPDSLPDARVELDSAMTREAQ